MGGYAHTRNIGRIESARTEWYKRHNYSNTDTPDFTEESVSVSSEKSVFKKTVFSFLHHLVRIGFSVFQGDTQRIRASGQLLHVDASEAAPQRAHQAALQVV